MAILCEFLCYIASLNIGYGYLYAVESCKKRCILNSFMETAVVAYVSISDRRVF